MTRTYDLAIVGGTVVAAGREQPATVAVAGGEIAALLRPEERVVAVHRIDVRGLHVLPGIIDTHVHTRHPGVPQREDFHSGTAAAAAGGITTLLEMPISKVPTNSGDAVRRRVDAMAPQAVIDFALYGGAGHENLDEIASQVDAGVVAFKTFLQPPPAARLDEFRGLWCTDVMQLRDIMERVRQTGLRQCFHCELADMYVALQARLEASGRLTGRAHAESRPPVVEEASVALMLALAAEQGVAVGIVHASSPGSVRLAADARARGIDVTVETCTPYLFFTDEALDRLGPFAKCNPPLRSAASREALWDAVREGLVDCVGTDHSPFLAEEKTKGAANIFHAPPGLCGLEVFVPLMLTAVHERRLTLARMATLCSEQAASVFGLARKGRLTPGADADLTIVDLHHEWTYDASRAVTRSAANMKIYEGCKLHGRVVHTIVRGVQVFSDGDVVGAPGHGRFVRPRRHVMTEPGLEARIP